MGSAPYHPLASFTQVYYWFYQSEKRALCWVIALRYIRLACTKTNLSQCWRCGTGVKRPNYSRVSPTTVGIMKTYASTVWETELTQSSLLLHAHTQDHRVRVYDGWWSWTRREQRREETFHNSNCEGYRKIGAWEVKGDLTLNWRKVTTNAMQCHCHIMV